MAYGVLSAVLLVQHLVSLLDAWMIVPFSKLFTLLIRPWYVSEELAKSFKLKIKSAIGICLSLCALTMTACGLAWSFGYYNWSLWGMWIAEGVFLLGKIILNKQNFNSYLLK